MAEYVDFIPQNTAPVGAKRIGVYNKSGLRVGTIKLGHLAVDKRTKQYSFGAISDVHLGVADSESDFTRALKYLGNPLVDFTCICGDMTNGGTDAQYAQYQTLVGANAKIPVYGITGNHDTYAYWNNGGSYLDADIESYINSVSGKPLYYTVEQGNDVFIMLGIKSEGDLFTAAELQWFYETLEANRNKRCFVFQHCFTAYGNNPACGNANGMYYSHCWLTNGGTTVSTQLEVFKSLLAHYKNTVFFHGHSHLKFRLQVGCDYANYDESEGYRSIHIPSISRPRQEDGPDEGTDPDYDDSGSEGYLVDVYDNGIHLRGLDFVTGEFLPIASYWIDTTLQTIPAGTYNDPTGTIKK